MATSPDPSHRQATGEVLRLVVVQLSGAFAEVWPQLAKKQGIEFALLTDADPLPVASDVAVVLLAAGGSERAALDWLDRHEWPQELQVLAIGADQNWRTAAQLVRRGASDYLSLPDDLEVLSNAVASEVKRRRDAQQRAPDDDQVGDTNAFSELVGESPAIKTVLGRASRMLPHANATTLIIGETGTGKELLARALHYGGPRRAGPFVPVDCSALPPKLTESELFGHERGAFTDAHWAKPGLFEVAEGGTLFLDEIGTLPLQLQAKLLRVLDDKHIRRVGGTKSRKVDVRVLAATNEDLAQGKKAGTFREDLYYRLSVVTHVLPPLRDRGHDVILIAEHLIKRLAKQNSLPVPVLDAAVRSALLGYQWPGNVRELKNALERAMFLCSPGKLCIEELVPAEPGETPSGNALPFPAPLSTIMEAAARASLEKCEGNRSEAARQLGISRGRLARLLGEDQPKSQT